jgi:hypothetical protein
MAEKNSLWKNIRKKAAQNKRTGATPKKPTKEMLRQERKIKAKKYYAGGPIGEGDDKNKALKGTNDTLIAPTLNTQIVEEEAPQWMKDKETIRPDEINFWESFNPKKWGLNDYSNYSSFNSAFRNAREAGEDEFVWNKERYNTNLIPKDISDQYWDSKKFIQDYYTNEPFIPLDTNYFDLHDFNDKLSKDKYGYTWQEYYDKVSKTPVYSKDSGRSDEEGKILDSYFDTLGLLSRSGYYSSLSDKEKSDYYTYQKSKYVDALNDPNYYFSITSQPNPKNRVLGYQHSGDKKLYASNTGNREDFTTFIHELSHKGDSKSRSSYNNESNRIPTVDTDALNKFGNKLSQKRFNYVSDPTETEARKMSTLYFMNKVLKKDISSGKIKNKDLTELYNLYNSEGGYWSSKSIPGDVRDLLELYKYQWNDLLKYLNNDFSYYKPVQKAKGGPTGNDEDPFKSKLNQGQTVGKTSQDWLANWVRSPKFAERLNQNFPAPASDLEKKIYGNKEARERASAANLKTINKRIPDVISDIYDTNFLYNTNPESNTGLLNTYRSRLGDPKSIRDFDKNMSTNPQGFTDQDGRIIITNEANTQYGPQSVGVHELTHKVSEGDKTLDKLFRGKFQTPSPDKIDANYKKDEMYPFLMQMRFDNKFQPGEEITPERLKQIRESGPNNHLFRYYNDDEISKYLNTLASNQTQAPMQYAAKGGYMYAEGGDGEDEPVTLYKKAYYNPDQDRIIPYAGSQDNEYYVTPDTPQGIDFERRLPELEITDDYNSTEDYYGNKRYIPSETGFIPNPNYKPLASGRAEPTLGPVEAALFAPVAGAVAGTMASKAVPAVVSALELPAVVGGRTIPLLTGNNILGVTGGITGANMLGSDINSGYYTSNASIEDKIARGLETGLLIGTSPGMLPAMGSAYKNVKNSLGKNKELLSNSASNQLPPPPPETFNIIDGYVPGSYVPDYASQFTPLETFNNSKFSLKDINNKIKSLKNITYKGKSIFKNKKIGHYDEPLKNDSSYETWKKTVLGENADSVISLQEFKDAHKQSIEYFKSIGAPLTTGKEHGLFIKNILADRIPNFTSLQFDDKGRRLIFDPDMYGSDIQPAELRQMEKFITGEGYDITKMTPKERMLMEAYAHGYDTSLNEVLRGSSQGPVSKYYLEQGQILNEGILKNKFQNPSFVRRGVQSDYTVELLDPITYKPTGVTKLRSELTKGDTFIDKSFLSTSATPSYWGPTELSELIEIPGGSLQSFAVPEAATATRFRGENEAILPTGLIRQVIDNNLHNHPEFFDWRAKFRTKILNPYEDGGTINPYMYYAGGPMQYKRGGLLKDIGLGVADFALSTIGGVTGIKSMKDIVNEKQYSNDRFDAGANFAGSLGSTALKLIPVTAPIANAAGVVGGAANKAFGIDAANYNPNQEVSDLEKAGNIVGQAGNVASMFMGSTSGVSEDAGKFMQGVDKINQFGQSPAGQLLNQGLSFEQGGDINKFNNFTNSMRDRYNSYRNKYSRGGKVQDNAEEKLEYFGMTKVPNHSGFHYENPNGGSYGGTNASFEKNEIVLHAKGGPTPGPGEFVFPSEVNGQKNRPAFLELDKNGMPIPLNMTIAQFVEREVNKGSEFRKENSLGRERVDMANQKAMDMVAYYDQLDQQQAQQKEMMVNGALQYAAAGGKINKDIEKILNDDIQSYIKADNYYAYGGYLPKNKKFNMPYSNGGKLPKEVLRARVQAHMSIKEANSYVDQYANGGSMDPPTAKRSYVKQGSNSMLGNNLNNTEFGSRIINEYGNGLPNDTSYIYQSPTEDYFYNTGQNTQNGKPVSNYNSGSVAPFSANVYQDRIKRLAGYANGGPVVSNVNQDFGLYAQNRGGMMMANGGMMPQNDSMSKQIAAALQQGADPQQLLQQLLQQLVKSGMDPQQAQAMLENIMGSMQASQTQAPMMAMGGEMYAPGGFFDNLRSDFNHGRRMAFNKPYRNAYNLAKGYNTINPKNYPNVFTEGNGQVGGEDYAGLYPMTQDEATQYQGYDPTKVTPSSTTKSGLPVGNEDIFGNDKLGKGLAIGQAAIPLIEAGYHLFNKPKHIKAPVVQDATVNYEQSRIRDQRQTNLTRSSYLNMLRNSGMSANQFAGNAKDYLLNSAAEQAGRDATSIQNEQNQNAVARAQAENLNAQNRFATDQLNYEIDQNRLGNIFGAFNNAATMGMQGYNDIKQNEYDRMRALSTQSENVVPVNVNGRIYQATKGPDGYYFNGKKIAEFGV